MRISEKTIEINFCSQFSALIKNDTIWFGLTQQQEAKLGFDTCIRLEKSLYIFQFKASNIVDGKGCRKFTAPHEQMINLRNLIGKHSLIRRVFYVLPNFGNTDTFNSIGGRVAANSLLLDVENIPIDFAPAIKANGNPKSSHTIFLHPADASGSRIAVIDSEKPEITLETTESLARSISDKSTPAKIILDPRFDGRLSDKNIPTESIIETVSPTQSKEKTIVSYPDELPLFLGRKTMALIV